MFFCKTWNNVDTKWDLANWTWDECQLVSDVLGFLGGVDASKIHEETFGPLWTKEPEKKKRFIKLICKIKNEEYSESKLIKDDIKLTAQDIQLVIKTVSGIELNIK